MLKLKTKWFNKWARKNHIPDVNTLKLSKDLLSLNQEEYRILEKSDEFIRIEEE
jgi:hypothetical protein